MNAATKGLIEARKRDALYYLNQSLQSVADTVADIQAKIAKNGHDDPKRIQWLVDYATTAVREAEKLRFALAVEESESRAAQVTK